MTMRYRKKPVVVYADRLKTDFLPELESIADWCGGKVAYGPTGIASGILIETLEGTMRADIGDWIICGVQNEFYPCKPDIFEATYEVADAAWDSSTSDVSHDIASFVTARGPSMNASQGDE